MPPPERCAWPECPAPVEFRVTIPDGNTDCYCSVHAVEHAEMSLSLLDDVDGVIAITRCW